MKSIGPVCQHRPAFSEERMSTYDTSRKESTGPEITHHVENAAQGGLRYARCESCGAESVMGAGSILHRESCDGGDRR